MNDKNRNLVVRIATAAVLLPVVIAMLIEGGWPFTALVAVAASLCALELNRLPEGPVPGVAHGATPAAGTPRRASMKFTGAAALSMAAAGALPVLADPALGLPAGFSLAVLAALTMGAMIDALLFEQELWRAPRRVAMALMGAVYPGLLLGTLVPLRALPRGGWLILLALTVSWLNDTGAYFAGRAFGRRKLYPRISPSKTWEGAAGGFVASVASALVLQRLCLPDLPLWAAAVIGAGAAILGPLGDLSESMLKRAYGVKDSGSLLPGHGGLLDRIDALLFVAPFVWAVVQATH